MTTANYPVLPEDWSADAESHDFDVAKVWSCFHYIAENSYGFTSTHPKYNEAEWLEPLVKQTLDYHGPEAARTIQTVVDLNGFAGGEDLPFDEEIVQATETLLKLAIVQSEYHREIRK